MVLLGNVIIFPTQYQKDNLKSNILKHLLSEISTVVFINVFTDPVNIPTSTGATQSKLI